MTKKTVVTVISLLAIAGLLIKGKGLLKERQEQVASAPTPAVDAISMPVVKATQGKMQQRISFLAKIEADKSIALSTKLAGYIESVEVEESQSVKQGDLLVRIDETELRSSLDALKITEAAQKNDLALAKSIYARNQKLYRIGGLAKEMLETSRVGVEMKNAQLQNTTEKIAQLEHQLSYLSIRAPFDGVVDAILLHEGDLAATGKPILRMSNRAQKLLFSFAPAQAKMLSKGQAVLSEGEKIGAIRAIYPTATNGLITAEASLDAPLDLPIGSSVNITVVTAQQQGCQLPDTTIVHQKGGDKVMVYRQGHFVPQDVTVLLHSNNQVMVKPCPKGWVANGSEVKLATLPVYKEVNLIKPQGESHE